MSRTPRRVTAHVQSVVMRVQSPYHCFEQEETVHALTLLFEQYGEIDPTGDPNTWIMRTFQ
jgi:hypothetical protein